MNKDPLNLKPITPDMRTMYDGAVNFENGDLPLYGTANGYELVIGGEAGELYGPWLGAGEDKHPHLPILIFNTSGFPSAAEMITYITAMAECLLGEVGGDPSYHEHCPHCVSRIELNLKQDCNPICPNCDEDVTIEKA